MPLLRTRVDVMSNFDGLAQELDRLARAAVEEGAREGASVARSVAAPRSRTGRMANITAGNATRTPTGWIASFVSPALHAWFQNYGTLGNRRKRLKQSPRTSRTREPGTGIAPLGFLDAGRRAGRAAMLRRIARGL